MQGEYWLQILTVFDVKDFVQADFVPRMMEPVVEYVLPMVDLNFVSAEEFE